MFNELSKQMHDFKIFQKIRSFGVSIYNHEIEIHEANQEQEYIINNKI